MRTHGSTFTKLALGLALSFGCSSDRPKPASSGDKKSTEKETTGQETNEREESNGTALDDLDWSKVEFRFTSPKDVEDLARGEVKFEVDTNLSSKGTWNLYYNSSFKSIEGALPIKEGMKSAEKSVTWDTMQVDPGTYFVFATLNYGAEVNVRFFQGAITVEEDDADNRTPFVSITTGFLNNNRPVVALRGQGRQLSFIAVEPDGESMEIDLEVSADDGENWTSLGLDLSPDGGTVTVDPEDATRFSLNYVLPGDLGVATTYRLRVKAVDESGKVGEAISGVFGVTDEVITFAGESTARPIRQIFADSCGNCHFGNNPDGNLRLDYYDQPLTGQQGARNRRTQINDRIHREAGANGFMPQNGSLSATDLARITIFFWDNYNNAGSDQPNVTNQNYNNDTNLQIGMPTTLAFTVVDNDANDRAGTAVVMTIDPAGTDQGPRAIDLSGVTPTPVPNGLRWEVSYTPPADMALGVARIRVTADDGRGRVDDDSRNVNVVAP